MLIPNTDSKKKPKQEESMKFNITASQGNKTSSMKISSDAQPVQHQML